MAQNYTADNKPLIDSMIREQAADAQELYGHREMCLDVLEALVLARQALINLQAEGESRYLPIVKQATRAIANFNAHTERVERMREDA